MKRKNLSYCMFLILTVPLFFACGDTSDPGVVINGITWATRNVDAPGTFAESPESTGMYYPWNSKKGIRWLDGSLPKDLIEFVTEETFKTNETPEWKSSKNPCPRGWRVPTNAELQSLIDAGWKWSQRNNISGLTFGSGASSIFLPAAGDIRFLLGKADEGQSVIYWSASTEEPAPKQPNKIRSLYELEYDNYIAELYREEPSRDYKPEVVPLAKGLKPVRCVRK